MEATKKRNFMIAGHAHCGKTSLAESLVFACGGSSRRGTVTDGNTISDYDADEIERKVSIGAALLYGTYKNHQIQMIDTPGYADFAGEVIASSRAVDAAVVVVDAVSGIGVGTEKAWGIADALSLPRIVFINKIDKEDADFDKMLSDIKEQLSKNIVVIESLQDAALVEAVAETDDVLLEKYLETGSLSEDEVKSALRKAVATGKVYPCLGGSALNDSGVKELLDCIVEYLPSPLDRPGVIVTDVKSKEEKIVEASESGPLSAFVFKTISDPYVGQLTLIRIISGTLASNTGFYNASKEAQERIGQIHMLQGKEQKGIDAATCGDIVAIAKLKNTTMSDSIADQKAPILFEAIKFPESAISRSVKPKSRADEDKISSSLFKLSTSDPTFRITRDPQTKEMIISGLGDLHLDIMINRLKQRFKVEVELGTPKVPYKETITKTAEIRQKYKKQSGGRGQYADVAIRIEPLPRGGDFEFVDDIFGGAVPRNFIPSVEKGVKQAMLEGAVAGYPIADIKVTLYDGSSHPVDSSDMAFQIAGGMALRKAMLEAGPALLEPVMDVEVVAPTEFTGQISGDFSSRRGRIMGMGSKGKNEVVKAHVPLAEMFKYSSDLRSMTGGRGSYSMSFFGLEHVPQKVAQGIISKYQAEKQEEA
ncbi:elongation factor G [Candidatus Omnitrophota bacterium]